MAAGSVVQRKIERWSSRKSVFEHLLWCGRGQSRRPPLIPCIERTPEPRDGGNQELDVLKPVPPIDARINSEVFE